MRFCHKSKGFVHIIEQLFSGNAVLPVRQVQSLIEMKQYKRE